MTTNPPAARAARTDGETTRRRILDAAGELFAAAGFAETTNKAIARRARVDLASINYHFGSRSRLYQAVLVEAHRRLMDVAELERLAHSPMPAADKLRAVMERLAHNALDTRQPWYIPVLTAELLAPSSSIKVLFLSEVVAKVDVVLGILSEITRIPAGDPALQRCLISVMAPALWLQIGRRGIPGPVHAMLNMPHAMLTEHLTQFALAGLQAMGQAYRGEGKTWCRQMQ